MDNAKKCGGSKKLAYILVIIGAVNWGLIGLGYFLNSDLNVVNLLIGKWAALEAIVYILVGVSGLMMLKCGKKGGAGKCSACEGGTCATHGSTN